MVIVTVDTCLQKPILFVSAVSIFQGKSWKHLACQKPIWIQFLTQEWKSVSVRQNFVISVNLSRTLIVVLLEQSFVTFAIQKKSSFCKIGWKQTETCLISR